MENCYLKLGRIYYRGIGVPKDLKQALIWLGKGAATEPGSSCMDLAKLYYYGEGVEKDINKAISLVEKAGESEWIKDDASLIIKKMRNGSL